MHVFSSVPDKTYPHNGATVQLPLAKGKKNAIGAKITPINRVSEMADSEIQI
jgi:hypothetical protein